MGSDVHVLARFDHTEQAIAAARALQDEGVRLHDAHAPFPLPALRPLPASAGKGISVLAALVGAGSGLAMLLLQAYSALDYPYVVGGKPLLSWPAFLPVTVALAVLASVVSALISLLWHCALPMFHHPVPTSRLYKSSGGDSIFLHLASGDADSLIARLEQDLNAAEVERMP